MAQQQEDGYYPRVNANLISASQIGQIVSLVGAVDGCDGTVATIRCGVGTTKVIVEPDFSHPSGHIMEAIGCVNDDLSIQMFVSRDMGSDFDMGVYNELITKVMANPKFAEYFLPPSAIAM